MPRKTKSACYQPHKDSKLAANLCHRPCPLALFKSLILRVFVALQCVAQYLTGPHISHAKFVSLSELGSGCQPWSKQCRRIGALPKENQQFAYLQPFSWPPCCSSYWASVQLVSKLHRWFFWVWRWRGLRSSHSFDWHVFAYLFKFWHFLVEQYCSGPQVSRVKIVHFSETWGNGQQNRHYRR